MSFPYNIHVEYCEKDGVYIARTEEFKYLAAHGDTPEEAKNEFIELIESVHRAIQQEIKKVSK